MDRLSHDARRRLMARVRTRDTEPELRLRRTLYALGVRGWRCHTKTVPGRPDICFTRQRVAVFVDGAFWHGHPSHFREGASGPFWDTKIARNRERDRIVNAQLSEAGWMVVRVWDFEVHADPEAVGRRVIQALDVLAPFDIE